MSYRVPYDNSTQGSIDFEQSVESFSRNHRDDRVSYHSSLLFEFRKSVCLTEFHSSLPNLKELSNPSRNHLSRRVHEVSRRLLARLSFRPILLLTSIIKNHHPLLLPPPPPTTTATATTTTTTTDDDYYYDGIIVRSVRINRCDIAPITIHWSQLLVLTILTFAKRVGVGLGVGKENTISLSLKHFRWPLLSSSSSLLSLLL